MSLRRRRGRLRKQPCTSSTALAADNVGTLRDGPATPGAGRSGERIRTPIRGTKNRCPTIERPRTGRSADYRRHSLAVRFVWFAPPTVRPNIDGVSTFAPWPCVSRRGDPAVHVDGAIPFSGRGIWVPGSACTPVRLYRPAPRSGVTKTRRPLDILVGGFGSPRRLTRSRLPRLPNPANLGGAGRVIRLDPPITNASTPLVRLVRGLLPGSVSRAMGSLIKKRRKRMRKKKHKKMLRRTRHQRQRGK